MGRRLYIEFSTPMVQRRETPMKSLVFSTLVTLCLSAQAFCGLGFTLSYTEEVVNPGEVTYRFFATPDSPEMQLIGIGGYSARLFQFTSETPLLQGNSSGGGSYLGWGEDETDFSDDFPAFEGTNVETFDGFYFDANLQTPLIGTVQIAQATLIEGSGFSFSGIARYLVNGDKIDLSFDLSTIPGASTLAAVLLLGAGSRRRN